MDEKGAEAEAKKEKRGEGRDGGEKHSAGLLLAALLSSALRVWRARQEPGQAQRSGSVPGSGPMLFTLKRIHTRARDADMRIQRGELSRRHAGWEDRRPDRRGLSSVSVTLVSTRCTCRKLF